MRNRAKEFLGEFTFVVIFSVGCLLLIYLGLSALTEESWKWRARGGGTVKISGYYLKSAGILFLQAGICPLTWMLFRALKFQKMEILFGHLMAWSGAILPGGLIALTVIEYLNK